MPDDHPCGGQYESQSEYLGSAASRATTRKSIHKPVTAIKEYTRQQVFDILSEALDLPEGTEIEFILAPTSPRPLVTGIRITERVRT